MAWQFGPEPPLRAYCAAAGLAMSALLIVSSPCAASTGPEGALNAARLDSTVRFLQEVQNPDGGFGGVKGGESDTDFSAWVALALAAAGINPQCQKQPGGVDAYTYLAEHASELRLTTEFERVLLVADAAGASPHEFGHIDPVAEILARQLSGPGKEGAFAHEAGSDTPGVNDTIFAVLALSPVHEPAVQQAVRRAAIWIEHEQYSEGSWPSLQPQGEAGEVDMTGAAIEALNAAGRHAEAQEGAFAYLHGAQNLDGGFPEFAGVGEESNVASTAWAMQGVWSAAQNPESWLSPSNREPLSYMASLQREDGSIQWKASSDANPVWMTAYAAPAFAGRSLPIPAVPPCTPSAPSQPSTASATLSAPGSAEAGQGGEAAGGGSGVIAGGGGRGAALFSRPQPQSQGKTRGGVRQLAPARASGSKPKPLRDGAHKAGGVIKGVLVAGPANAQQISQLGAPGLHSAAAGGSETPWLAIAIGGLIALLAIAGSQLERRRTQVVV